MAYLCLVFTVPCAVLYSPMLYFTHSIYITLTKLGIVMYVYIHVYSLITFCSLFSLRNSYMYLWYLGYSC